MTPEILRYRKSVESLLEGTGITLNGDSESDIQIKDDRFYARVLADGSLGLGESYMDGWWECGHIDELMTKLLLADIQSKIKPNTAVIWDSLAARLTNRQSRRRAFRIGKAHYDLGNDLYQAMLDRRMTYTCGYWKDASDLDQAQEAKLDLVCRKLGLRPGQKVLDIGCGWGSFLRYAVEKYGVTAVGITVSKEQVRLAKEMCQGLPIEIRLQDYRELNEQFDHIVSLGMIEHVGYRNYPIYFRTVHKCLRDEGLFLLHSIGGNVSVKTSDPWISKYIFPNSMLPSAKQLAEAAEGLFVMEDWHNFGAYYDKTLMAWHKNFESHWENLKNRYDERFHRMWDYYLLSCAGTFRARQTQLWQIVFSKKGLPDGYVSVR